MPQQTADGAPCAYCGAARTTEDALIYPVGCRACNDLFETQRATGPYAIMRRAMVTGAFWAARALDQVGEDARAVVTRAMALYDEATGVPRPTGAETPHDAPEDTSGMVSPAPEDEAPLDSRVPPLVLGGKHRCPVAGCTLTVPNHQLMCPRHWAQVPEQLKSRVYGTWRARTAAPWSRDAYEEHMAAMRAATDAVNGAGGARGGRAPARRRPQ
jgi:hypothetical protein